MLLASILSLGAIGFEEFPKDYSGAKDNRTQWIRPQ